MPKEIIYAFAYLKKAAAYTNAHRCNNRVRSISDLLVEIKAIEAPLRQVRYEFGELRKKKKKAAKSNSMFASRDSFSYSEEEIAEYEREEGEALKNKRPKGRLNLGDPHG